MLDSVVAVEEALAGGDDDAWRELRRRASWLTPEEATVIDLWYRRGQSAAAIASTLGRSVRHVYRLRTAAIERLAAFGHAGEFIDADVAEFA